MDIHINKIPINYEICSILRCIDYCGNYNQPDFKTENKTESTPCLPSLLILQAYLNIYDLSNIS